jgi:hypothetical protein
MNSSGQLARMRKTTNAYKIVFGRKSSDICLRFNIVVAFIQIGYEAVDWNNSAVVCGYSSNKFRLL